MVRPNSLLAVAPWLLNEVMTGSALSMGVTTLMKPATFSTLNRLLSMSGA